MNELRARRKLNGGEKLMACNGCVAMHGSSSAAMAAFWKCAECTTLWIRSSIRHSYVVLIPYRPFACAISLHPQAYTAVETDFIPRSNLSYEIFNTNLMCVKVMLLGKRKRYIIVALEALLVARSNHNCGSVFGA